MSETRRLQTFAGPRSIRQVTSSAVIHRSGARLILLGNNVEARADNGMIPRKPSVKNGQIVVSQRVAVVALEASVTLEELDPLVLK